MTLGTHTTLRSDLDVTKDPGSVDGTGYLLHDRRDHRVWQIRAVERATLRLLDGTRSLADVQRTIEQEGASGGATPSLDDITEFAMQLAHEGLLVSGEAGPAWGRRRGAMLLLRRIVTFPVRVLLRWLVVTPWDFLSLETRGQMLRPNYIRLGNPDRLLALVARILGPLLGRATVIIAIAYFLLGLGLLIGHFDAWWESVEFLWNPWGVVLIAVAGTLVVHIPHQLAHGVVLVRHGARAPSWGIQILFHIVPILWVDVNDTRWLAEKRHRMSVLAAGLLWQGVAFTTGIAGWLITGQGTAALMFLALSSTSLFGLVLNANPLARRDGYNLLSTWFEVPELRHRASALLRAWVRWAPFPEPFTRRERRWFALYSLAVNVFGIVLTITASLFAVSLASRYDENGATLVLFAGGFVFQDHFRSVFHSTGLARAWRWLPRVVVWVIWLAAAVGLWWVLFVPYPYHAGGETTLVAVEEAEVRTELEGLIADISVTEGMWVEKGQQLAVLHAPVQERNLYAAEAQLAESKARQSALVAGRRPEEVERARSAVLTAEAQLAWSTARAERAKPLFDQKVISVQEYETAMQTKLIDERKLDEARAALAIFESGARNEALEASQQGIKSQQAMVAHFKGNVQRTAIVSPISGYVTTPDVQNLRGRYLQPGQRDLVTMVENTKVLVAAIEVPQEDISGVSVGGEVTLYTWSYPGREFKGRVSAIAPVATDENPLARSVIKVRTEIPNADGLLKPKMTGYAKIRIEERPVWDILFRPLLRWLRVEVWSWLP